jgi:phosphoglycerate dehydrogenase-like enzyme
MMGGGAPMPDSSPIPLSEARVVRLNARSCPVREFERSLYERLGMRPELAEASAPDELASLLADCDAVLVVSSRLPAAVVDALRRCRVIARLGIGTDRIDVGCASARGIVVANVPGFCSEEMADHALALLLALARQLPRMARAFADGAWRRAHAMSERNHRLAGRTLGLVGFGDSAKRFARRARACGMRVIAVRRNRLATDPVATELGVAMVDLATALRESDYLSLHLPLSDATRHLIDATALRAMKRGACLINTARGGLVDEDALVAALRAGRLAGAGLDTFESIDPFAVAERPPSHALLELDNVVLTPHVGANSIEGGRTVVAGGIENLRSVLAGCWPRAERVVDPQVVPRFALAEHDPALDLDPELEAAR